MRVVVVAMAMDDSLVVVCEVLGAGEGAATEEVDGIELADRIAVKLAATSPAVDGLLLGALAGKIICGYLCCHSSCHWRNNCCC